MRTETLKPLYAQVMELRERFAVIEFVAIPRELNHLADALAWEALSGQGQIIRKARGSQSHQAE